jgi:ATP-dependent Lhr-like helicase
VHAAILQHLGSRGASFLEDVARVAGEAQPSADAREFRQALWDLVWSGQITNDTFAPLRSLAGSTRRRESARGRSGRSLAGGRWSLVRDLLSDATSDTERVAARTHVLLERYGIVSREAAIAEETAGGFAPIYQVLKTLEETGRVRRGLFVDGLSGAQFALPGSVDRLRSLRLDEERDEPCTADDVRVLAAVDPANPYGSLLSWPESGRPDDHRARRVPGAALVLVRGRPALWVGPRGRHLTTFPSTLRDEPGSLELAVRALHALPRGLRRGTFVVEKIDGGPVRESPLYEVLRSHGFQVDYRGLIAEPSF